MLCNAEAYDNWPSADERPIVALTQTPVLGGLVMRALATRAALRLALKAGHAVKNNRVLDDELVDGYLRANLSDAHRRAKTARFLAGQLDPANNRWTTDILDGLRRFDQPTLLLWAADDPHFGPRWAERPARRPRRASTCRATDRHRPSAHGRTPRPRRRTHRDVPGKPAARQRQRRLTTTL